MFEHARGASIRVALGLTFALLVAACASSNGTPSAPASTGADGAPASQAPTSVSSGSATSAAGATNPPAASIPAITACDLLPAATVSELLGGSPVGVEDDPAANYKTCRWTTSGSGNANQLTLSFVIKVNPGDQGFGAVAGDSPVPLTGVGDSASYAASGDDAGFGKKLLIADKGRTSVALGVNYGGTLRAPDSTQANFVKAVESIFSQLGS
jgi:Protein of unknown function (DUF3558)